jgi:hypothetical protein
LKSSFVIALTEKEKKMGTINGISVSGKKEDRKVSKPLHAGSFKGKLTLSG